MDPIEVAGLVHDAHKSGQRAKRRAVLKLERHIATLKAALRGQSSAYEKIYDWVRVHLRATCPADGCDSGPECLPCMKEWPTPAALRQLSEPKKEQGDGG
jgi:hypothetical protein